MCCVIPIVAIIILDLPALRRRLIGTAHNITGGTTYNQKRQIEKALHRHSRDAEQAENRGEKRGRADLEAEADAVTEVSEV